MRPGGGVSTTLKEGAGQSVAFASSEKITVTINNPKMLKRESNLYFMGLIIMRLRPAAKIVNIAAY